MRKLILTGLAACSLLLLQNCSKKDNIIASANGTAPRNKKVATGEMSGVLPTGTYQFINNVTFGSNPKSVGVTDSSSADNAHIEQRTYAPNKGQEWTITDAGGGYYFIINTNSGKALDVPYGSAVPGRLLWQRPADLSATGQKWKIEYQGGFGVYRIYSYIDPTLAICISGNSTADGAELMLNPIATSENKYFMFYRTAYKDRAATNWFKATTGWIAGDGGAGLKLSSGKVIFAFGDSHYNDYSNGTVPCLFNTRNLARVQATENNWNPEPPNTSTLKNASNQWLFCAFPTVTGCFNWPSPWVEAGGYVYNLLANFKQVGGTWNYNGPPLLAKLNATTLDPATVTYHQVQFVDTIDFARGFTKDATYIYVYGNKVINVYTGTANGYVARFPISNPNATWNFWNGSNWNSQNVMDAVPIYTGLAGQVCQVGSKFVRTGVKSNVWSCNPSAADKTIMASWSNSPTGPWSADKPIYQIDDTYQGQVPQFYGGTASAANINGMNEIIVVYSINGYVGNCITTCINNRMNPDVTYRPRAIRVPLKLIDASFP